MSQRLKKDYYETLDLSPGATSAEVEEAYRRAMADFSEDSAAMYSLYTPEEKGLLIGRINEAYAVLCDPARRAAYDAEPAWPAGEPAATREFDMSDLGAGGALRPFTRYARVARFSKPPVTADKGGSMIAEQYRILYSRLNQMAGETPLRSVAITSAVKGEGKSVTSLNFAYVTASEFKKRVLLVECDMRKPSTLAGILEREETGGLADVLEGKADVRDAVCRVDGTTLYLLTSGTCFNNSSELIDSPDLKALLAGFRDEFDYVIVDTPPILPLADMNIISRLVDGTILVVRAGVTPKNIVLKAVQSLSGGGFIGVVLNGADTVLTRYYY